MDIKLVFLTVSLAAFFYRTEVQLDEMDQFSAIACQRFPIHQTELYHFVTFPDIADKWLNWMTYFASADHKAIGIGKIYKAVIKNFVMHFRVTEFLNGDTIIMESNFLFRPRVELQFSEPDDAYLTHTEPAALGDCACGSANASSRLVIKLYFQRNSLLFQYTLGTIFRSIFEYQLRESLQNLLAILVHSTTCPNLFLT